MEIETISTKKLLNPMDYGKDSLDALMYRKKAHVSEEDY
jgi:hypothetical protein